MALLLLIEVAFAALYGASLFYARDSKDSSGQSKSKVPKEQPEPVFLPSLSFEITHQPQSWDSRNNETNHWIGRKMAGGYPAISISGVELPKSGEPTGEQIIEERQAYYSEFFDGNHTETKAATFQDRDAWRTEFETEGPRASRGVEYVWIEDGAIYTATGLIPVRAWASYLPQLERTLASLQPVKHETGTGASDEKVIPKSVTGLDGKITVPLSKPKAAAAKEPANAGKAPAAPKR